MMERREFKVIMLAIDSFYPGRIKVSNEMLDLWYEQFRDNDFGSVMAAVQEFANTDVSGFPPTIGQIKNKIVKQTSNHDWSNGWDLVTKAVRRFGYYQPKSAISWIASQDKVAAEAINRLGYPEFCMADSDDMTWRANFRMAYEQIAQREEQRDALPENLRQKLDGMFSERKEIGYE